MRFWTASPASARVSGEVELPRQGQLHPLFGEDLVARTEQIEHFCHANIGHCLLDDFLDLHRGESNRRGCSHHEPKPAQRLWGNHGGELHHQAGGGRHGGFAQDLVDGEVVKVFDEFRIGFRLR